MGSSGGGSSGAVSYPAYVETVHEAWLGTGALVAATDIVSIDGAIAAAINAGPPLVSYNAYPVANVVTDWETAIDAFKNMLEGLDINSQFSTLWDASRGDVGEHELVEISDIGVDDVAISDIPYAEISDVEIGDAVVADRTVEDIAEIVDAEVVDRTVDGITDAEIVNDVDAFAFQLDDEIHTKVLPRFRRGMQDINAVVSSAFPIGHSIIEGFRDRDVDRHASTLRLNAAIKNADLELGAASINLSKDTTIAGANLSKDIKVADIDISKDVTVAGINLSKDTAIAGGNLSKDVEVGKINITKDSTLATINISKDIDVAKINVGKDVEVSKTNITKELGLAEVNTRSLMDYMKLYLSNVDMMEKVYLSVGNWQENYARLMVEAGRIKIVANSEEIVQNAAFDKDDATWDLEVFQYGGNLLAGVSGGTSGANAGKPNVALSVLGGALSGAAAGGVIGGAIAGGVAGSVVPVYGTIIGAVLGAAMGLMGSM